MAIYIGSEHDLRKVPWDEANPRFYVVEIGERSAAVRDQFPDQRFVYYAGSHEGCGCGFQYGQYLEVDDEEQPRRRQSLDQFADYLEQQVEVAGPLALFACWEGDQGAVPEHARELCPSLLRRADFFFLERERSVVRQDLEHRRGMT